MATEANNKALHADTGQHPDAIQAARDYGIDISMLMDNINRTPAERIRRHQMALDTAEMLRKARRP